MLNKKNRLTSRFEFNVTRKYGQYFEGTLFHIYVLTPKNYSGATKIGIVISNKFSKKAVERNKAKRIFREIIRKNLDLFGDNKWIVIHPKYECIKKEYEEINADFTKTLQKISFSN